MVDKKEVKIDGIVYVPKSSLPRKSLEDAKLLKGKKYVIARTYSAGVFAGYLDKRNGREVTLINARRLWYWDGASSLSQLAMEGTVKPGKCKFPVEVKEVLLTEVIEILPCTEKARLSIAGVAVWEQK